MPEYLIVKFALCAILKYMDAFVKIFGKFPLLVLVIPVLTLGSCDFFRRVAGRPDSEELAAIRTEVLRRQAAERDSIAAVRSREDSVKAERERVADSLRTLEDLKSISGNILSVSSLGGMSDNNAVNRYYVVLGSYKLLSNARALATKVENAGFRTVLLRMKNGLTIVAADPADRMADALSSLKNVRRQNFCPEDVWILVNE